MKFYFRQKLSEFSKLNFKELLLKFLMTGVSQILIQVLTLIGGIIVIRTLSTKDYALYTIVNTMIGAMSILTDSGISSAMISIGGENWRDPKHLGTTLNTGFESRRKFSILSMIVVLPLLFIMLKEHTSNSLHILLIIVSVVPGFYASVSSSMYEVPLKLYQDIEPLQRVQLLSSILKVLLFGLLFIFPNLILVLVLNALSLLFLNKQLLKFSRSKVNWDESTNNTIRKRLNKIIFRLMPEGVFSCLSGQITVWLIALFGSTTSIAGLGALSRFSVAIRITGVLSKTILTPRFARLDGKNITKIKQYYWGILFIMILFYFLLICLSFLVKDYLLLVLGDKYSNLGDSLILVIIGGCAEVFADLTLNLNNVRGWSINPLLSIPLNLIVLSILVFLLNISSLNGVLLLTIITSSFQALMHLSYGIYKFKIIQ